MRYPSRRGEFGYGVRHYKELRACSFEIYALAPGGTIWYNVNYLTPD
jgi:hypothetical protein